MLLDNSFQFYMARAAAVVFVQHCKTMIIYFTQQNLSALFNSLCSNKTLHSNGLHVCACGFLNTQNKSQSHLFLGPAFWGLINPEWHLCNKGRRQSPVNLEPQRLLFDPNLRPLHIDKHRVGILYIVVECAKVYRKN